MIDEPLVAEERYAFAWVLVGNATHRRRGGRW